MSILSRVYSLRQTRTLNSFPTINSRTQRGSRLYSTDETQKETKERVFFKEPEIIDGFPVFDVYMNKKKPAFERRAWKKHVVQEIDVYARCNNMPIDQDWTNVWPTANMFKQNAVPLPLRQGAVKNMYENDGLPPAKFGNTELMKIPNFLHLTPPHIKKQCAVLKEFCTKWPAELKTDEDCETYFPVEITTSNYIYDGPSIRDDRARVITLEIKVESLGLDDRAKDKFIKLAQHRYDPKTDILKLVADRCPYRRQNIDYANYLLRTLYFESKNIEEWESEMTEEDSSHFEWEKSRSKNNIMNTLSKEQLENNEKIKDYKNNLTKVFEEGDSLTNMNAYKDSVIKLLNLKKKSA